MSWLECLQSNVPRASNVLTRMPLQPRMSLEPRMSSVECVWSLECLDSNALIWISTLWNVSQDKCLSFWFKHTWWIVFPLPSNTHQWEWPFSLIVIQKFSENFWWELSKTFGENWNIYFGGNFHMPFSLWPMWLQIIVSFVVFLCKRDLYFHRSYWPKAPPPYAEMPCSI